MKILIHDYIEGRTEKMISEGELEFERVVICGSKFSEPDGISFTMQTQKKNTSYGNNKCTVELIFDKEMEEYKWFDALIDLVKTRAFRRDQLRRRRQ